jgi:hypothetical protein
MNFIGRFLPSWPPVRRLVLSYHGVFEHHGGALLADHDRGALVLPLGTCRMIEASATRSRSMP